MGGGKARLMGGTMISGGAATPNTGPAMRIVPPAEMAQEARRRMEAMAERRSHSDIARENEARQRAWVADQLSRDVEAAGSPVEIQAVDTMYAGFTVRLLQWLPHGVGAVVRHEVRLNRPKVAADHVEAELRRATTERFRRFLATQRGLADRFGPPRLSPPEEIDLSGLAVERPLRAAIETVFGDGAGAEVRHAVSRNVDVFRPFEPAQQRAIAACALELADVSATISRGRLTGTFTVTVGDTMITWSKGSVAVLNDANYPDALIRSLPGRRLEEIVQHPLIDGSMTVTAATAMRRGGRAGVSLVVKQFDEPVPSDW